MKIDDMDSASQILEIAERHMRQAGYNAVSYRDIAAEMGIKSASLHYHFPKKEDMGCALIQRYADKFHSNLNHNIAGQTQPESMIAAFIETYRQALEDQGLVCLCAVLGAEAGGLPEIVSAKVKDFFEDNINWLAQRYQALAIRRPIDKAKTTLSLLEGAMIISAVNDDISVFNAATAALSAKISH